MISSSLCIVYLDVISKVAIIITKSATIAFFSSPPFLYLRYCDFGASESGLRNLPFDAFSLKWLHISLGCLSRNRLDKGYRLYIYNIHFFYNLSS